MSRVVLACAASALALTAASAQASSVAAKPADNPCFFSFAQGIYVQHNAIVTGGQATCMPKPDSFHIDLRIEYFDGADWKVTAARDDNTRPDPFLNIAVSDLDCKKMSTYRGHAIIWVAYQGTFDPVDKYTDRNLNTGDCEG